MPFCIFLPWSMNWVMIFLDDWNNISAKTSHLASLTAGSKHTMADFDMAGGVLALMKEMESTLNLEVMCTGNTMEENIKEAQNLNRDFKTTSQPFIKKVLSPYLKGISPQKVQKL